MLWLPKIISGLAQLPRWATLIAGMIGHLKLLGGLLVGVFRSHAAREAEIAFLPQVVDKIMVRDYASPARQAGADQREGASADARQPSALCRCTAQPICCRRRAAISKPCTANH